MFQQIFSIPSSMGLPFNIILGSSHNPKKEKNKSKNLVSLDYEKA